jgi:hypothetical protein
MLGESLSKLANREVWKCGVRPALKVQADKLKKIEGFDPGSE